MIPDSLRCLTEDWEERPLPASAERFLKAAQQRIDHAESTVPKAFVPADYAAVYQALAQIERPKSSRFLEWGAGFGVVAGLATMLGWQARGIELDQGLASHARALLEDFGLPVDIEVVDLHRCPIDADLVFMYMWPDQLEPCLRTFAEKARLGTQLLYFDGGDTLRLLEQSG